MKKEYYMNCLRRTLTDIINTNISLQQMRDLTALGLTKIFTKYDCRGIKIKEINDFYKLSNKRFKKALLKDMYYFLGDILDIIDLKTQYINRFQYKINYIEKYVNGLSDDCLYTGDKNDLRNNDLRIMKDITFRLESFNDTILCKFQEDVKSLYSYVSEIVANELENLNFNYMVKLQIESLHTILDKLLLNTVNYFIF